MGQGLGKNSPVVLSLGKENYEALISRHGQWVRWRTATKCPCVKSNSMQPDLHCEKCGGRGVIYGFQKKEIVSTSVMILDDSGIVEIPFEFSENKMLKCYDNAGNVYENAVKQDNFIILNSEKLPAKGVYLTVVMEKEILQTLINAECEKIGNGYYKLKCLQVSKNNIDGLFHTAPCDIQSIEKITDANGNIYKVKELRQNCFYIEPLIDDNKNIIEIAEPLTVENVKYIKPFTFVLIHQELSKTDAQTMQELNGDAILCFPYYDDVATDDVVTVLAGTITEKKLMVRQVSDYDVLPDYFIECVSECLGKEREYKPGIDFLLLGTNYIYWICEDCPEEGECYSVTYRVYPTYKVVKSIPQLRSSENQRMPKKAIIKYYDTYAEKKGVNRQ